MNDKLRVLVNTLDDLSKNPLFTREGRAAYAASKRLVMQTFLPRTPDDEDKL